MIDHVNAGLGEQLEDDNVAFNPLSKSSLADSVGIALNKRPAYPISALPKFEGAGIYALYYKGNFAPYSRLVACNANNGFRLPIYLGKADPPGKRKGAGGGDGNDSQALRTRLLKHGRTIADASNLDRADFYVKFLVVDVSFIGLCESLLIARLAPLWNTTVDGFGNNDPGSGRGQQVKSRWHTLHPGGSWASKLPDRPESVETIRSEVEQVLRGSRAIAEILDEAVR